MEKSVKTICTDCHGTGLYEGFFEKKGHPVVCIQCEGSGCCIFVYAPFTHRKIIKGVKSVSISNGSFIPTGVGAKKGTSMTYEEFLKSYPKKKKKS